MEATPEAEMEVLEEAQGEINKIPLKKKSKEEKMILTSRCEDSTNRIYYYSVDILFLPVTCQQMENNIKLSVKQFLMHCGVVDRSFELDHPGGFASSPWAAAMLGHHHSAAAAAAAVGGGAMMQADHGYPHPGAAHHHSAMPMDLHVPQGFSYYRYREEALCWTDRKPPVDEVGNPTSVNARILELRKEKSRDAARSRRGKENFEFYELAKMLPLPAAITSQLDKASIIRLTISYLKLRDFSGHGDPPWQRDHPPPNKSLKGPSRRTPAGLAIEMFEQHQGTHILQSLDGFPMVVAADGRLLYVPETVSIHLGLSQVEMSGSSIFDYIHHSDHAEMAEQLGLGLSQSQGLSSPSSGNDDVNSSSGTNNPDVATQMSVSSSSMYKGLDRAFCIRMKSTLTKRGCHFKSSGYRVVLLLCRLRPQYTFSHSRKSPPPLLGMVALAIALPPPSVHEIRLESDMFVTRINFDFRIAHCEPRVSELLDYTAEELTGRNLYTLCHGEDANKLRKCHIDLINKGQVLTHYYRLMNKSGGYTWLQTCATVVCNTKNAEEQNVICVNYVLSAREYGHLVMDCCQMESTSPTVKRETGQDPENGSPDADPGGRSSGGPASSTPDSHSSPPNSEGRSPESPSERHGRPDQTTQLQGTPTCDRIKVNRTVVNVPLTNLDKNRTQRKSKKRKLNQEEDSSEEDDMIKRSSPISEHPSPAQDASGGTVKDLEDAMSKHLPTTTPPSHQPTDFSTDALLKQQRGAIQWVGHHLGQTMPASALLRQLYANRESVIRANVHAGGRTPTGTGYYSDGQGPLPTPPGSEGSSTYGDHQFVKSGTNDAFNTLPYPGYHVDYHSAMTPPSSVSPRDKHQLLDYSELRHPYLDPTPPAQPLPLKPQAYSAHPSLEYLDQYQGAGFHLYHPNKSYADPHKTGNWYSAAS